MALRKPIVHAEGKHDIMAEGDVLEVSLSKKQGNLIKQEEDGLFAAAAALVTDTAVLSGTGESTEKPLGVRLRPGDDNQLRRYNITGMTGLHVRSVYDQVSSTTLTAVMVKPDVQGEPNTTNMEVKVSPTAGNMISKDSGGLYAAVRHDFNSQSVTWDYVDNKSAPQAAGMLGEGCYVRSEIKFTTMSGILFVPVVQVSRVPCNESGEVIPHSLYVGQPRLKNGAVVAQVTIVMASVPTHTLDMDTMQIEKTGQANTTGGIPPSKIPADTGSRLGITVVWTAPVGMFKAQ